MQDRCLPGRSPSHSPIQELETMQTCIPLMGVWLGRASHRWVSDALQSISPNPLKVKKKTSKTQWGLRTTVFSGRRLLRSRAIYHSDAICDSRMSGTWPESINVYKWARHKYFSWLERWQWLHATGKLKQREHLSGEPLSPPIKSQITHS